MSIATEISRLQTAKADLKTAIEGKGVTVPSATKIDGYADLVDSIETGGGGISIDDYISGSVPTGDVVLADSTTTIKDHAFDGGSAITSITGNGLTRIGTNAFTSNTALKKVVAKGANFTIGSYALRYCSALEEIIFPNAASNFGIGGYGLQGCSSLKVFDLGYANNAQFPNLASSNFDTIILRKNGVASLQSSTILDSTKFASGGAGGTVYIPEAIYNHLGDGTSMDYKASTNWAVYDGYGTITWAKIEGSIYDD